MLPLVPPERGFWSPYSGLDAMCGNVLLISLDELAEEGLIDKSDLPTPIPVATANFDQVLLSKSIADPSLKKHNVVSRSIPSLSCSP